MQKGCDVRKLTEEYERTSAHWVWRACGWTEQPGSGVPIDCQYLLRCQARKVAQLHWLNLRYRYQGPAERWFIINIPTWLLEEPVDLALMYVVIFGRREEAEPIYESLWIRSGIKEIQCQEVGHRSVQSQLINVNKRSDGNLRISALDFQNIISNTMDVLGSPLNQAIR